MHKKLDLKCTCYKTNICKVGFPVVVIQKYIERLNKMKYGYVIHTFDLDKVELKEIAGKRWKYNKEISTNIPVFCAKE